MFSKITNWVTKSSEKFESVVTATPTYTVEEIHEAFDKGEQEVIEEAAERLSELQEGTYTVQHKITYKHGFIDGAKWQQDQIPSIIEQYLETAFISEEKGYMNPIKWFEQFKKK